MKNSLQNFFKDWPLLEGFSESWDWLKEPNHANPFYSPLYYTLCRHLKAKNIVEVGPEHGYTSYMLATAAKENDGMYIAIEKSGNHATRLKEGLVKGNFPHKVIWADSKDIKDFEWMPHVDFVLLDGEHTEEAISHEFELFYPKLHKNSYVALHDIDTWSASGFWSIIHNSNYNIEYITFPHNYGVALFRKIDFYEEEVRKKLSEQYIEEVKGYNWTKTGGDAQKPGKIEVL